MDPLLDPALPGLVSLAMERRDQGIDPDLDEICAERPDLRDAVAATLAESERIPTLQRTVATRDPLRGRIFHGRYRLTERLGAGAMGVVYEALDLELNRPVAVKVLRSLVLADEEAEVRFEREGSALAALHHDSIVTVFDRGRAEEGEQFLVMELLDGLSLSSLLDCETTKNTDTTWVASELGAAELGERSWLRLAVRWIAELAEALQTAHEAGILHRDIKPSNVFIRRDGRAMLLDFGIASAPNQETITREGSAVGTPAYMAPESLSAAAEPQATLDVYGLSATLYHLVTRRAPYEGTPSQIISRLITKDPPRASKVRAGLHRDLQAILDRGMARLPRDRYASAKELASDLRAFLDHLPVKARPLSAMTRGMRQIKRSPVGIMSASLLLAAPILLGVREYMRQLEEKRQSDYHAAIATLPPNRDITLPSLRETPEHLRTSTLENLHRAVSLEKGSFYARLRRASFLLDHGNKEQAVRDMRAIAAQVGSEFARELARRYEQLPESGAATDLNLKDLPEATQVEDLYLRGYHEMRALDRTAANATLLSEELENYAPAGELRIQFLRSDLDQMFEATLRLEAALGGRTATTANLLSSCLYSQGRFSASIDAAKDGLELAPNSVPLLMNLAASSKRRDANQVAREAYAKASELSPRYARLRGLQLDLLLSMGELEDCELALEQSVTVLPSDKSLFMTARYECERALQLSSQGDLDKAQTHAEQAKAAYQEIQALYPDYTSHWRSIAYSFVDGEHMAVFDALLELTCKTPRVHSIRNLLKLAPEELNPEQTVQIMRLIAAMNDLLIEARRLDNPGDSPVVSANIR